MIITTLFALSRAAQAAPGTISFSARLRNATGGVVADGHYNVEFKLYSQQSGGTPIWSESYTDTNGPAEGQDGRVRVVNGYLGVQLGSRTPFTNDINWGDNLWLTMNIGGTAQVADPGAISWDGEMSPRIQLTAVPYAMSAGSLNGFTEDDFMQRTGDLQSGSLNLSGSIQSSTSLLAPVIDTANPGEITIGANNATSINLAQDVTIAPEKSLTLAGGATSTRPESPAEGTLYYDTTTKQLLVFTGDKWQSEGRTATQIVAASNSSQAAKDGADFVADGEAVIGIGTIDGDQQQINAAIAALPPTGGTVYLTEGTYRLDDSIVLPSNVTLTGAGAGTVLTVNDGFDARLTLVVNSDTVNGNSNITVRDLTFHGNRDNLIFSNAISGINFTRVGSGAGTAAVKGASISNNSFLQMRGDGVLLAQSHQSSVNHNTFTYLAGIGTTINAGANNRVTDNAINGAVTAIRLEAASHSTVSNNSIEGSTSVNGAVDLRSSSSFNTINANSFRNNTRTSLRIAGLSSGNMVSNNLFADNGGSGSDSAVWLAGNVDDNTISRNTFRDTVGTGHAINIDNPAADRTYLDGNSLGGPGASTINDAGTGTIYGGQQDSSGSFVIRPGGDGGINLSGDTAIGGTLEATEIQGSSIDSGLSGSLSIGAVNASNITIGNANSSTNVEGALSVGSISGVSLDGSQSGWVERTDAGSRTWSGIASSSDGSKIVANVYGGSIYTSTNFGETWVERTDAGVRDWSDATSSADGTKLAAVVADGYIYTSADSGVTWTEQIEAGSRYWMSIASSADGTKLVAAAVGGYIYTSSDSGATWTEQTEAGMGAWISIASSSDGTKLAAAPTSGGFLRTSTDSGASWQTQTGAGNEMWRSVAISDDGSKIAALTDGGNIYTTANSGADWVERTEPGPRSWSHIDMSSDGSKIVAVAEGGSYIYISRDSGDSWSEQTDAGARNWLRVTMSANGNRLAVADGNGSIYTYKAPMGSALSLGTDQSTSVNIGGQDSETSIGGSLTVEGSTQLHDTLSLKTGINSTHALAVQNSSGNQLFRVDTENNRVVIGQPDGSATLLVIDTKTTSGDPIGTDGAMYYNSQLAKFRCFEGGAWTDCITPLPISLVVENDLANDTDEAIDVEDLQFTLAPDTKYYYKFMLIHEADEETTGIGFGVTTPTSPAMSNWCVNTTSSLGSVNSHWGSYCGVGDASATTQGEAGIGTSFNSNMEGYIQTGANGGELTLRFKSQTNDTTTIKKGSFGILQIVQ